MATCRDSPSEGVQQKPSYTHSAVSYTERGIRSHRNFAVQQARARYYSATNKTTLHMISVNATLSSFQTLTTYVPLPPSPKKEGCHGEFYLTGRLIPHKHHRLATTKISFSVASRKLCIAARCSKHIIRQQGETSNSFWAFRLEVLLSTSLDTSQYARRAPELGLYFIVPFLK